MKSFTLLVCVALLFNSLVFAQEEQDQQDDEIGQIFTRLADWFTENDVMYDTEISLGYPTGIIASKDIVVDKKKVKIVSIPKKIVISDQTPLDSSIGHIFKANPDMFEGNLKIAVWLLHERLDEKSFWTPYLDSLPELNTPMFWSQEKKNLLKGSWILDRVERDTQGIQQTYDEIFDFLFKEHSDVFTPESYPFEDFLWVWGIIFQRSVWIDGMGQVIVPMLDSFNHVNEVKSEIKTDKDEIIVYMKESVKANNEIYINKGDRPNNDLLRLFGFILRNNGGNVAFLDDAITESSIARQQLKEEILIQYDALPPPYPYGDSPSGLWVKKTIPSHVVSFYRIKFWEPTAEQLKAFEESGTIPKINPMRLLSDENEKRVIRSIVDKLEETINRYPESYKEDRELLKNSKLEVMDRLAIQTRFEEKKVLNEARLLLMQQHTPKENIIV